jgi:hypothetical protein
MKRRELREKEAAAEASLRTTRGLLEKVKRELDAKLERYRKDEEASAARAALEEELERTWDDWFRTDGGGPK